MPRTMKRKGTRKSPYSKPAYKRKTIKKASTTLIQKVKSVVSRMAETKFHNASPYSNHLMSNFGPSYVESVSLFRLGAQGVGENEYLGRSVQITGIRMSVICGNNYQNVTASGFSKEPMHFNFALIESDLNNTSAEPSPVFNLDNSNLVNQENYIGAAGLTNNALVHNFNTRKMTMKWQKKIIVRPGNTDDKNTYYDLSQNSNYVSRSFWIPYKRKITYQATSSSANLEVKGKQAHLLFWTGQFNGSGDATKLGKLTCTYKVFYKDM